MVCCFPWCAGRRKSYLNARRFRLGYLSTSSRSLRAPSGSGPSHMFPNQRRAALLSDCSLKLGAGNLDVLISARERGWPAVQ